MSSTPLSSADLVLVVGGTGGTGVEVVRRLQLLPDSPTVRVMSRSSDEATVREMLGDAVEVHRGDVADAECVRLAMNGVTHAVYVVGPRMPSLTRVVRGPTMEAAYVTGLKNVLGAPRSASGPLRQLILLSAQDCDSPWGLIRSVPANAIFGLSSLMHLRQERLLRDHAAKHEEFSYVVVRPPIFTQTDGPAEAVAMATVGARGDWVCGPKVSRAAVAEVMVHALAGGGSKCMTLEMSSVGTTPAPADFDWAAQLASLPADGDRLPPVESDVWHLRAPRIIACCVAALVGLAIVLPIALF